MLTFAPLSSASIQSLATIISSAQLFAPPSKPSCFAISPSLTPAVFIKEGSSSCKLKGTSSFFAFSMASYKTFTSIIGSPSSLNPTAPWSKSSSKFVSSFPSNPLVILPTCKTLISAFFDFSFI